MTTTTLVVILIIMMIATLFQASIGFGANLIAQPLVFQLEPDLVPGSVLMTTAMLSVLVFVRDRRSVDHRMLATALAGAVIGIGLGVYVIRIVSETTMAIVVASCVLAMVALVVFGGSRPRSTRSLFLAGNAGGFGSVTAGIGGPPLALLFTDAEGHETRGFLAAFFLATSVLTFIGLVAAGRFGARQATDGLLLLPAGLVGFALSKPLLPLVDRGLTRPAILVVSGGSAALLLLRSLVG